MRQPMKPFAAIFLVLLLVLATEIGPGVMKVEGRYCETPSQKFRGVCVSKRNCGNVCATEGFSGGDCRGFRRRCFCTRPC